MQPGATLELGAPTPHVWLEAVLNDFDAFLIDHAACERKASANALSLVSHYPDRGELVRTMIDLAREELDHFRAVYRVLDARGLQLGRDRKDPYLGALRAQIRNGRDAYFLDRLLIAGIAEARGHERFGLIAASIADPDLERFYTELADSEARHAESFVEIAGCYFDHEAVGTRLAELLSSEAELIGELPIVAALH